MFQFIVLSVSSDVITFHHEGGKARNGVWEMNWEKREVCPDGIHGMEHTRQKKKGKKVLCRVESELPLVPISLCLFMGQAASLWCGNRNGRNPLGWHVLLKGRPPDVSFDPVSYAS